MQQSHWSNYSQCCLLQQPIVGSYLQLWLYPWRRVTSCGSSSRWEQGTVGRGGSRTQTVSECWEWGCHSNVVLPCKPPLGLCYILWITKIGVVRLNEMCKVHSLHLGCGPVTWTASAQFHETHPLSAGRWCGREERNSHQEDHQPPLHDTSLQRSHYCHTTPCLLVVLVYPAHWGVASDWGVASQWGAA